MKVNYVLSFLFLLFISVVVIASIDDTDLIGCTELNGNGCVCHSLDRDYSVHVWVEGPESLYVGQTGYYKMFMYGGPAEAGGYNVAGRFGQMVLVDSLSFQHPLSMNELTQAFPLPFPSQQDTIYWDFGYTASDTSAEWDTIYSCGISLVWDSIPDFLDRWNYGPKFPVHIVDDPTGINNSENFVNDFQLYQNYPNPFNPDTKIKYHIPSIGTQQDMSVQLKIYDILGNEIATLVNEEKPAGIYEVSWNASGLTSGIYFYRLKSVSNAVVKKMILAK